jgi:TolB-like protein
MFGYVNSQTTKVAILDFENISGKTEYDALGKAISSMLITDLANNIHPKKVEFYERSQLNKLLDEQKLQKSKNFDTKTAVDFGKLSGVNYVFMGSIFVLDGTCNFSSKLVDVQTSKILFAKEVSGKIEAWLQLKSQLAEAIASQLNNPITLDPVYKNQSTTLATLNQYGKILFTMDGGDVEKAEQMRSLFEETNPDFKYYSDIKEDIEQLKKKVEKNTEDIEVLKNSGGRVINPKTPRELVVNYSHPLSSINDQKRYVLELLKFNLFDVSEGYFNEIYNMDLPYIRGVGYGSIENWQNALNFLDSIFIIKDGKLSTVYQNELNPKTVSYYVILQIYNYACYYSECKEGSIKYILDYDMKGCTVKAIQILDKLFLLMLDNNISDNFDKNLFQTPLSVSNPHILCPHTPHHCYGNSCDNPSQIFDGLYKFLNTHYVN